MSGRHERRPGGPPLNVSKPGKRSPRGPPSKSRRRANGNGAVDLLPLLLSRSRRREPLRPPQLLQPNLTGPGRHQLLDPLRTSQVKDLFGKYLPLTTRSSCHKRQKPQAPTPQVPIRNRQTRKVANAKVRNRCTNLTRIMIGLPIIWLLLIGACGVGACGFWRYRMRPTTSRRECLLS